MRSEELMNKYGKRTKPRHKIALNRLTSIVNSTHLNLDPSEWRSWNSTAALDMTNRVVRNSELFSDLAGAETGSLHTPDLNEHAQKVLNDLQSWRQAHEPATGGQDANHSDCRRKKRRSSYAKQHVQMGTPPTWAPRPHLRGAQRPGTHNNHATQADQIL